ARALGLAGRLSVRSLEPPGGAEALADRGPGQFGRLLLGFLLGPAFAFSVDLAADSGHGAERLLVVGPALIDEVFRSAEFLGRGEFLQRGLPVEPGSEP